jgi:protocatechuate 4,5-dioxygenase beta chain
VAKVVGVFGVPHNPFHHRATRPPRERWTADLANMQDRYDGVRERLTRVRPEAIVSVGNDHFHQFFMDNMPAFILGKMDRYDGTFYNEVREFDLPRVTLAGDAALAGRILEGMLERGVDLAFSDELKVDHSVVVPLLFTRPELDLPIVPLMSNCVAPPLPTAARFHEVGRTLRAVIDALPGERRIAILGSGNLSLEVGGPLQFAPHAMDAEFDAAAVGWIANADVAGAVRECTYGRLVRAGNVSHGFLNYLLLLGAAGDAKPTYAEGLRRTGSTQAYFAWEMA